MKLSKDSLIKQFKSELHSDLNLSTYEILSSPENQSKIGSNYRKLTLYFHPDKQPSDSGGFIRLTEAKEALTELSPPKNQQVSLTSNLLSFLNQLANTKALTENDQDQLITLLKLNDRISGFSIPQAVKCVFRPHLITDSGRI